MFHECLQRDEFLAVAYFQRGVIACQLGRYCCFPSLRPDTVEKIDQKLLRCEKCFFCWNGLFNLTTNWWKQSFLQTSILSVIKWVWSFQLYSLGILKVKFKTLFSLCCVFLTFTLLQNRTPPTIFKLESCALAIW